MKSVRWFLLIVVCFSLAGGFLIKQEKDAYAQGGIIGKLKGVLEKVEGKDKEGEKTSPGEDGSATKKEDRDKKTADKGGNEDELDMPDELEWKPDFIVEDGEKDREVISTTDEQGNTTTVYKTKNDVWVKKVTDKNGNVILDERKVETPDGGKKVETIDHKAGTKTQATYDAKGRMTSSYTENINGTKTAAKYKGGVIMVSKTTDSSGNVTGTTYDNQGRVEHSETKDKAGKVKETTDRKDEKGTDIVKHVDHEKGVTTVTATAPDGSKIQETRDNKTGETLSEVGISADGKLFTYKTGSDADKAFEKAERISMTKISSTQDWVKDKESEANESRIHKDETELDRQLEAQMAGGKAVRVSGDDIIVSSNYKDITKSSRRENQEGELETSTQQIAMSYEVRGVKPDGDYGVKPAGAPVFAEQYGKTPSEALFNALESAAATVITNIKSEFLDRMRHMQKTDGGVETRKDEEDITSTLDASSFAVFDKYEVESVKTDGGNYVVKVRATPGVTVRK